MILTEVLFARDRASVLCHVPPLPCIAYRARVELHQGALFLLSCNGLWEEGEEVTNMAGALQLKA